MAGVWPPRLDMTLAAPVMRRIAGRSRSMPRTRAASFNLKPWLLIAGFVLFMALPALLAFAEG